MKLNFYLAFLLFLILDKGLAQDYHFSQFDANPFYINPALTGERLNAYDGVQINADYRDQMSQYTKSPGSFNSFALGADEPLNSKFSLGQSLYNNKSATGSFNSFGFMASAAHHLIRQKESNQNLSVGLQIGVFNTSIHSDNFSYATQYSSEQEDGFDESISSGESFIQQSYTKFNMNFGIYYRVTSKNKKLSVFSGFSIYNITQSNQSFFGGYSAAALRFNLHGGLNYAINKNLTLMPQLLYMNQAKATELNLNLLIYSKYDGSSYEPIYGFGFRNKDAVIFQAGLKHKGTTFRLSYDVVINYTKTYKNRGLEFSLVHTLKKSSSESNTGIAAP